MAGVGGGVEVWRCRSCAGHTEALRPGAPGYAKSVVHRNENSIKACRQMLSLTSN